MSHKRPLDGGAPEQEAARSPRKRLRRTVLVMMWLERRRARVVTLEQMAQLVRQMHAEMAAKWFMLVVLLVARLGSMERVVLNLQDALQRFTEQFPAFQRSLMGSIKDTVRSAVRTEMQERQATLLSSGVCEPPRQILEDFPETGVIARMVKLCFVDSERPKDPLYTGCPVQWQNGANAKVAIFENERQITEGDLSKLQIEVLAVHADFCTEQGQTDFTKEEFNKQIYTYKGKESVLTTVNLANGEAYLGSFFFPESSYRKKLRLAARVKRRDVTVRVQEAITYPFVVKDRRSELNEKSYPPSKEKGVHCLEKISLKGIRCSELADNNITTVKHLLRRYHRDKSGLQKLTGMKKENWSTMIEHATTCDPGVEIYSYRVAEESSELLFNDFYDLVGRITNGSYVPYSVDNLDQFPQLKVNNWKMAAHKKFEELENLGSLIPDYVMSNGFPVRVQPPNSDASPSIQAGTTWQCSNCTTVHQELGQVHPSLPRNELLPGHVFPNNGAGPSTHETLMFQRYEFGQPDPSMLQNGTPYHLTQGNIFNCQGSFSVQSTILPHDIAPVQCDNLITAASLVQHNGYPSYLGTDAPGSAYPVTDVVDHVQAGMFNGLPPTEFQGWQEQNSEDASDLFSLLASDELVNFGSQFHGYENDDGNGDNFRCP